MSPHFSIIIPVYNVAPYLRECLDSVLAQTFTDWEAICVDDGSTDGSGAILDEYALKDGRYKVVHKRSEGVSVARNVAMQAAWGYYVCFLDGDDVWSTNWLQRFFDASLDGRADIVRMKYSPWARGDEGGARPSCRDESESQVIDGKDEVLSWGWQTYTIGGHICLNAVKRELLANNNIKFPEGMLINEDIIFDLKILPFAETAVQSSYAGYFYRMRSTSAWHARRPIEGCVRYFCECNRLWDQFKSQLVRTGCADKVRRNQTYAFWSSVAQWLDFGKEEDRGREGEIVSELRVAWRQGMIDVHSVLFRWRLAFWLACRFGMFHPLYVTWKSIKFCSKVRQAFSVRTLKGARIPNTEA